LRLRPPDEASTTELVHVLVTGFESFDGVPINPSERLVAALPPRLAGVEVRTAVLSVDVETVQSELEPLLAEGPSIALHLGVAARRKQVSLETRAANWVAFSTPDNAGHLEPGRPICEDAPEQLNTRLPIDYIESRLTRRGIPVNVSRSAGRFICNFVMFDSLQRLPLAVPSGFIHVPADEELSAVLGKHCYVRFDQMLQAVTEAISATAQGLVPVA
jgi:pyroglutamyl-peptidase